MGLGLIVFIFCSVDLSQAALDARYDNHILGPVNEHPWQESGSPPSGDTIRLHVVSPVFIVIGPIKLIIIKPSRVESVLNGNRQLVDLPRGKASE